MRNISKPKIALLFFCIFLNFSSLVFSQSSLLGGMGEVSEIIIPATAKMQNNNNMYYEVHLMDTENSSPSFWYKIIFKEACNFEFTLFPIVDDDGYDFYFFRVNENMDFCDAIQEEKLISCNAARIYKQYNDTEQSDKFRSKLVNIKALPVQKNDAIYIEVFSTVGNNCGHVLDFRTTSSSFVVKVVNEKCKGGKVNGNFDGAPYKPVFTEKEAIRIFRNTVCHLGRDTLAISSIKAVGDRVVITQDLIFDEYSKEEAKKYKEEKNEAIDTTSTATAPIITDTIKVAEQITTLADTQKVNTVIKSTADLNDAIDPWTPIKHEIVNISSKREKNATRLDVDLVLFSLLKEDLKRKMQWNRKQQKDYSAQYKKASSKAKKTKIKASIADVKEQRVALLAKSKNTRAKLKQIQKLLSENRKKAIASGGSVFTASVYPEAQKEKNKVEAESSNAIIENPTLPSGIIYKIQIGVYKNKISSDIFKGLSPVCSQSFPGGIKYYAGAFRHYTDARNAKEYIKTMGLADAFIVAYNNGKRVVVKDARAHEPK